MQAARQARLVDGVVRIPGVGRLELELVVDAVQAGGDHRGKGQVGVHVGAGDPALERAGPAPCPTTRKPHVRLSTPQTSVVGANDPQA